MVDRIEIGPVPASEDCEQLGEGYSAEKARRECRAFINQLKREFGKPPTGASYVITSNRHDFGTYYEVAIRVDDQYPEAVEYAYRVEENCSDRWDLLAMTELGMDKVD